MPGSLLLISTRLTVQFWDLLSRTERDGKLALLLPQRTCSFSLFAPDPASHQTVTTLRVLYLHLHRDNWASETLVLRTRTSTFKYLHLVDEPFVSCIILTCHLAVRVALPVIDLERLAFMNRIGFNCVLLWIGLQSCYVVAFLLGIPEYRATIASYLLDLYLSIIELASHLFILFYCIYMNARQNTFIIKGYAPQTRISIGSRPILLKHRSTGQRRLATDQNHIPGLGHDE